MIKVVSRQFIPVLLGGDINTYSVARAFYERYQVRSRIFGKYPTGPSFGSRIIEYSADTAIETDEGFLRIVNGFAQDNADKKIVLLGCGDSYVALIAKHRSELADNIIAPYIDYALMNKLQTKRDFYELCEREGIDYPHTLVISRDAGTEIELPFELPVFLKPSNSISYWEHPFPTQKKVYYLETRAELARAIEDIYAAGYPDELIVQEAIPGSDEAMRVLTTYSDRHGAVKMMCLGHVLLEEHTPHGLGNHALIITEPNEELMARAARLLESLGYIGFANFDIKYDSRDGKYKFFEINTRQGRSNYYVTGSGLNIAKYVVEEYVNGAELALEQPGHESLWTVVPQWVMFRFVTDPAARATMRRLIKQKKMVNPVFLRGDLPPKRFLRMARTHLSHVKKFATYYDKDRYASDHA